MKTIKVLALISAVLLLSSACSSPKEKAENKIKKTENKLFSNAKKPVEKTATDALIKSYIDFAHKYPKDSNAVNYLFKAADLSMNTSGPKQAVDLFDEIMKNYPDYSKVPQCLFLKGYIYENYLNSLAKAKEIYTEFLKKYPDDDFADDAQASLNNLGKSPEELIKEFEAKAKKNGK